MCFRSVPQQRHVPGLRRPVHRHQCSTQTHSLGGSAGLSAAESDIFVDLFICACAAGYRGARCQLPVDDGACASRPCLNGASCMPGTRTEDYTCRCAEGFTGLRCDVTFLFPVSQIQTPGLLDRPMRAKRTIPTPVRTHWIGLAHPIAITVRNKVCAVVATGRPTPCDYAGASERGCSRDCAVTSSLTRARRSRARTAARASVRAAASSSAGARPDSPATSARRPAARRTTASPAELADANWTSSSARASPGSPALAVNGR